jgi:hypothetical protein
MFYFYDVDGYVSEGSSSDGLFTLIEQLEGPAAKELLEDGWTERLDDLATELGQAIRRLDKFEPVGPNDARVEITTLQATVHRASEILILTDGVFDDLPE